MRIPEVNLYTETLDTSGGSARSELSDMRLLGQFSPCYPPFLKRCFNMCIESFLKCSYGMKQFRGFSFMTDQ